MFWINFAQPTKIFITYKITPIYIILYLCHRKNLPYPSQINFISFI